MPSTEDFGFSGTTLTLVFAVYRIAPPAQRGEVTAAFITCVYPVVAVVGCSVAALATATLGWHLSDRGRA
jgi:hypothetical protein